MERWGRQVELRYHAPQHLLIGSPSPPGGDTNAVRRRLGLLIRESDTDIRILPRMTVKSVWKSDLAK